MAFLQHIPAPPEAITRVLSRFDRAQLVGFIAVAIDLLDLADGDTDIEDDNEDRCPSNDDYGSHQVLFQFGPGDGYPGDPADAEEDDPSGQRDEDGINTLFPISDGPGCSLFDGDRP